VAWSERNKAWHKAHPGYRQRYSASILSRFAKQKLRIETEYKTGPCADCGTAYPPWVMEFDHRNPAEKKFAISNAYRYTWARIVAEIAKCDLVCSNCHAERTHRRKTKHLVDYAKEIK